MDFLFHKVSDEEREEIKKETKRILDDFSAKLGKVGKVSESLVERKEFEREEGEGTECDEDFRKRFFENAPNKKGDFILGEKKGW
ncbi:MAG: hypothetical protein ABIH49_01715 [archaeon]